MAQNFLQLILLLGVGGVWLSIGVPAASRALIQEMPGRRRGLLFGIGQTAAPIGTIFAGIVLPGVALDHGWHAVFLAAMVFPAVAFLTVGRDTGAGAGPRPAARPPDRANPSRREVRDLLTLTVACGLGAVAIGGLTSFFVVSAVDAGQSDARAGHLLVLGGVVGIATRIVGGWYSDRSRHDPLWAVSLLLFAGSGGLALLATGSSGLVVVATVLVYGAGWGWPGLFYYGVAIRGGAFPGRATGTVQVGMALGNVLGPLVVGQISSRDDAGFGAAWSVMAALTLLASVVVLGPLRGRDRVNS
jgi:MFS family permease